MWANITDVIKEYLLTSSIHGPGYLIKGIQKIEIWSWIFAICLAVFIAGGNIDNYFQDLMLFPVSTTISTLPIESIPYPAIVIKKEDILDPFSFMKDHEYSISENMLGMDGTVD